MSFTTTLFEALNKSDLTTINNIEVEGFVSLYGGDKIRLQLADETDVTLTNERVRIDGSGGTMLEDGTEITFRMFKPMTVEDVSLIL